MLVLMQILRCGSGRQKEALKRLHWIHGLMSARDDSGGCIAAKHLGNPIDIMILRYWQTAEALARRTNSYYQDEWPLFPPNEPEGIYQTQDISHNFEEVSLVTGAASGGFILRSTYRVAEGRLEDCLALWSEIDALLQRMPGLVSAGTYKGMDDENEALRLVRLRDRAAMEAVAAQPEFVSLETKLAALAMARSYPDLNIYETECFEVADEY